MDDVDAGVVAAARDREARADHAHLHRTRQHHERRPPDPRRHRERRAAALEDDLDAARGLPLQQHRRARRHR
ncbi:MAG TPA: hypothetical protein VHE35_01765, partial [Kofleriaceae bacterium]|nr:hypothetical protein [Kofleriaceae bacterium]